MRPTPIAAKVRALATAMPRTFSRKSDNAPVKGAPPGASPTPVATSGGISETAIAMPVPAVLTFGLTAPYAAIAPETTATPTATIRFPSKEMRMSGTRSWFSTMAVKYEMASTTIAETIKIPSARHSSFQLLAAMPSPKSRMGADSGATIILAISRGMLSVKIPPAAIKAAPVRSIK